jgi:multidrug resistance efflux pump
MGEKASSRGARRPRSKRRGLRSQINLDYTDIRSPIAGEVSRTSVTEGNVVSPTSDVLTTIVSQDRCAQREASRAQRFKSIFNCLRSAMC